MSNTSYQTYLINLDRATERLEMMENEFIRIQLPFVRISAVDAKNLDKESFQVKNRYDRDLLPGEIGCFLSHVKTLKTFLDSDKEFAVIIEDDAKFVDDFVSAIEKALNSYSDLPAKHQWDVLKLINNRRRNIFVQSVDEKYFIGACGKSIPITTLAAIWTRKGAEKFLRKVNSEKPIIQRPIDCELQHPWEYNLLIYNLLPTTVASQDLPTQIVKSDNVERKAKFLHQIRYELNRFFPKIFYYTNQHGLGKYWESFVAKKTEKVK